MDVFSQLDANFDGYLANLQRLVAIPSVSVGQADRGALAECAAAVRERVESAGLKNVKMLEVATDVSPYIYGEWMQAEDAPTVLFYAHYDVVPVGGLDAWQRSPWELTERDGRLVARGASDDKGGIIAQLAAIESLLASAGKLPCNVKVLFEGEEEIGSPHLSQLLAKHRDLLGCDCVIGCDTDHVEIGRPSITHSLRGGGNLHVTVQSGETPFHSGMTGGLLPDPACALAKVLAKLWNDDDNRIAIPGFYDGVRELSETERQNIYGLPMDEAKLLRDHRQVANATLAMEPGLHAYHQVWRRPCIVVTALEASSIANATNQILPKAEAVLNIRLVPDQNPQECRRLIQDFIRANAPWNLDVKVVGKGGEDAFADPWHCEPEGPIFAAALDALEAAYGQKPATIGCGGTIPCIDPFWQEFHVPILLFPIGDPESNAHSSNESLHIASWKNLMKSLAAFLQNLAG